MLNDSVAIKNTFLILATITETTGFRMWKTTAIEEIGKLRVKVKYMCWIYFHINLNL